MNIQIQDPSIARSTPIERETLEAAVVRFAGDSGDGMQLTGSQFTLATAIAGNDLVTFPDFPAEIRAPVGTTFGVSTFQINFGTREIRTAGDALDVLVVMNPAALITNLADLRDDGLLIVDASAFQERNLKKAGYDHNPLEDDSLARFRVLALDISKLTQATVKALDHVEASNKEILRSKNMWALGLVLWLFGRDTKPTRDWLGVKFAKLPEIARINAAALEAGHAFGETVELPQHVHAYSVPPAHLAPGEYRNITGTEGICWGLATGAHLADLPMIYCSYPITPASNMLHVLARLSDGFGIETFQAEDEIAAVTAAIGASYAGSIGVTGSSGPGVALKTEGIGLAVAVELPLIVVNAQRGGPSTGLPTKTEQSDLYQAVFGRNADCPLVVLAARSPGDCYDVAIEAVRLATKYMTPVILLTDGYIANSSEPWNIPHVAAMTPFKAVTDAVPEGFAPFMRDAGTLARPWVVPGTPGGRHRIGGIERANVSGNVSYDPENHQLMTDLRARKIRGIADDIPLQEITRGEATGDMAVVGWGSTFGPITRAVSNLRDEGLRVSHIHLGNIWPLPRNLGTLLEGFGKVLVPEMNNGQLVTLLRSEYLVAAESLPKVSGKPFKVAEIETAVRARLGAE
jgi:2-oxoglutarate ferredoxin oxidoreductase subunit alpha